MKKVVCIAMIFCLSCMVFADENIFFRDLQKVYTTNVKLGDKTAKPTVSRIRKLFYDGNKWDMVIPDAKNYLKPTDAFSLEFQRNYRGDIMIQGEKEDFKHMLAGLDSYLHAKAVFGRAWSVKKEFRSPIMNYDLCSWMGDAASALAEAYKQSISLQIAYQRYAGYQDFKANVAAFHISKLAQPSIHQTYQFPIAEICRAHYMSWHDIRQRRQFLESYFSSLKLKINFKQGHWKFTKASLQTFYDYYKDQLKAAAYLYYFGRTKETSLFSDQQCLTILDLFLAQLLSAYQE